MAKEFFCGYHSYLEYIKELSDAEVGRLFRACLTYSKSGAVGELPGAEKYVFPAIRYQIDRDNDAYAKKCESQKTNGSKGGRPKTENFSENHSVIQETQITHGFSEKPKKANEKEKENEKENEISSYEDTLMRVKTAWNGISSLPHIESIPKGSKREKAVHARLDEYGIDKVLEAIELVKSSDFLTGATGWKASFDWLIAPSNFLKVIEGNYTNKFNPREVPKGASGLGEAELAAIRRTLEQPVLPFDETEVDYG